MTYPSFLWKTTLSESSALKKRIPENVFSDLMLTEELRSASIDVIALGASGEDIAARQGIFRLLLDELSLRERLFFLKTMLSELERLYSVFAKAETRLEKTMIFPALIERYLETVRSFASITSEDCTGRIGEIVRYFRELIGSERLSDAMRECRDLMSVRRSELLYTVRGGELSASVGGELFCERMRRMFSEMGLPEAIPTKHVGGLADSATVVAYAEVYSEFAASAERFCSRYEDTFIGGEHDIATLFLYVREIDFLHDMTDYLLRLTNAGYPLTYPTVSEKRELMLDGVVDASLVRRGLRGDEVVPNDLRMSLDYHGERLSFYMLTGANGGGKTTFLRACGVAVILFLSGCPITARSATMWAFETVYTHFPAKESFENSGRFANEAERVEQIVELANEDSFVLFNETYSGTDEEKSERYSRRLADTMYERGVFGLYVTHIHTLTGGRIPTLAAVIDENDGNRRTYKLRRVGSTDSSFASDILERYHLDRASLERRGRGEQL